MSLKLYADFLSQPCRAVGLLLEKEAVPYEMMYVSLLNCEGTDAKTKEEFARVNPFKKVPAIDDKGFTLFESAAILKYLVRAYNLPSHWYPEDVQKRARVDQYLAWHQGGNIRNGLFPKRFVGPAFGMAFDQADVDKLRDQLREQMVFFQDYFLGEGPFMCGSEMSIADLQAMCELNQFWMAGLKLETSFPKLEAWMKACQELLGESFEKVYKTVYEMAEKGTLKGELEF